MRDFDLNNLKSLGLTGSISYDFSGEGDDGYWNISNDNLSFPDNFDDKDDCYECFGKIFMDELPSGWETNYGSYGDMKIDFDEEKIYFSIYERGDLRDPEVHNWLMYVADQYHGETEFIYCSTKTIYDLSWGKIDKIVEYGEPPEFSLEYLADDIDLTEIDYDFDSSYFDIHEVSLMNGKGIILPEECLEFYDLDLSETDLSYASLGGVNLSGANLSGANLSGANLSYASLSSANLSGANLSGADLSNTNLSGANLSGADLSNTNLSGADLSDADLSNTKLSGVDLSGASLWDANLKSANLSGANLTGVDLTDANLTGADLTNAYLSGADLTDADLTDANLEGIITDENTKIDIPEE